MTTSGRNWCRGWRWPASCAPAAHAFQFEAGSVRGSLDSTLTAGFGQRVEAASAATTAINPPAAPTNTAVWGNGDDGNLNYDKGDLFTTHPSAPLCC